MAITRTNVRYDLLERKKRKREFEILMEELNQGHIVYDKITNHGTITSEQEKFDARF